MKNHSSSFDDKKLVSVNEIRRGSIKRLSHSLPWRRMASLMLESLWMARR